MKFSYQGFDKAGTAVQDTIEAADKADALDQLRRRGVFVSQLAEPSPNKKHSPSQSPHGHSQSAQAAHEPRGPAALRAILSSLSRGRRLEQVAGFTRQLALLVSTGTPLVEAITSLERQAPPGPFHELLTALRTRVEEGAQLSDAITNAPHARDFFDPVAASLIRAGEQGGRLDLMLQRLADLLRQQTRVRKTVQGAMIYPCLLIFVAISVVTAMLGFVLPRFEGLFKSLDAPLPVTTEYLMAASHFLAAWWWAMLLVLIAAGLAARLWLATAPGKAALDRFLIAAPLGLGKAMRSFATARIARMLGTLLDGKVALLEALSLTQASMTNSLYQSLLQRAQDAVTRGENVSVALCEGEGARDSSSSTPHSAVPSTLILASVLDALKSAEKSGQMAPVLTSIASYLDEDNQTLLKALTSLLEPMILIVLGLIVGAVAISMFLPLFDLTAAAGGPR